MDIRFSFTYHIEIATSYFIKCWKKKDSDTKKYNDSVKEKYNFDEKASVDDKFEHQIVMDILNNVPYDQIKTVELYVEPTVQGAQTIDDKIKQENEEFLQTPAEFNKIDMAATAQKKAKKRLLQRFVWCRNWFNRL